MNAPNAGEPDGPVARGEPRDARESHDAGQAHDANGERGAQAAIDPLRLRALFDELAELPADEADRRMAADLRDQPALRAALARLLLHDRGAAVAGPLPAELTAPPAATPEGATEADPVRLGRFHVVRRLGQGGMGVVYDAYDDVLDRRVALKLLTGTAHEHAPLLREARALARLSHPNVVSIYEVGEHAGRPFIAMERVEGQPLSTWLQTSKASFDDTLRLLLPAGWALSAAHERGVIHRDFKPQNVLVGSDGRVRVVDFGIAALRALSLPAGSDPPIGGLTRSEPTASGLLAGTPAYMAPEQLGRGEVTPRCDQFAFAVVLYRTIYGQAPFAGDDLATLRDSVLAGALRPPPRRPELPAWLWPILARALSTDPALRFPSMAALLGALEEHLPKDPMDDPLRTRTGRARLLAGFLACSLLVAGLALWRGPRLLLGTHQRLVTLALVMLLVASALVGILWRQLSATSHGRRSVGFLVLILALLLGHRLLGWRLEVPVPTLLATDLFLLGSLFACGASLLDRWLLIPTGLFLLALAGTAHDAQIGALLFPVVGPGSVMFLLWRTLRR
jgi:serine/threonine-protein kinase